CSSLIHKLIAVFWRFLHKIRAILTQLADIMQSDTRKERMEMTELELKKLYRRIERASRLRTPWYLKLASLLSIFF
ncbi:MAG: hypothetical protein IKI52_02115, partial [Clostridia bacterium]|nr:hypothetical protein [Clostridia bacterium]